MAPSLQQEPHFTIGEQSESWWQVLHESGNFMSSALAATEIMTAAMTTARGTIFFRMTLACSSDETTSEPARPTSCLPLLKLHQWS
jgi:hypothetical protein